MGGVMKRATVGLFAILACFGLVAACNATPTSADTNGPEGVRVQEFKDPRFTGDLTRTCLVLTHDTAQGASIAVTC